MTEIKKDSRVVKFVQWVFTLPVLVRLFFMPTILCIYLLAILKNSITGETS